MRRSRARKETGAPALFSGLLLIVASSAVAQTLPSQPAVTGVEIAGSFAVPRSDGAGVDLAYGGHAIAVHQDGRSLYWSCSRAPRDRGGADGQMVARVSIPVGDEPSVIIEPCRGPQGFPTDVNGTFIRGVLPWGSSLLVSGYKYYTFERSGYYWRGAALTTLAGPVQLPGTISGGMLAGWMLSVPTEWRESIGWPALTGLGAIQIISRSSHGPALSGFDPDDLSRAPLNLLGYPQPGNPALGTFDVLGPAFSMATSIGGMAWPRGTSSIIGIGRYGTTACYGIATDDPSLHMVKNEVGEYRCYDLVQLDKGSHGYPYRHVAWIYRASDLVSARRGDIAPSAILPTMIDMPGDRNTYIESVSQDATGVLYGSVGGGAPRVVRWRVLTTAQDPPTDPCVAAPVRVAVSDWPRNAEGTRSARWSWSVDGAITTLRRVLWAWVGVVPSLEIEDARGCVGRAARVP
jgi:hypothetical protein